MPDNRLVLSQLQKIMQHVILKIWKINGILYTEEFVISWIRAKASTEARPGLVWLVSYHYTNTIWTRRNIFLSQKYFIFAGGRQIKSDNQMLLKWTHSVFLTPWSYSNSVILEYTGQWTKSVIVRGISKTNKVLFTRFKTTSWLHKPLYSLLIFSFQLLSFLAWCTQVGKEIGYSVWQRPDFSWLTTA